MVIVGPTASGKTALSLALARHFAGEIVSCDSVALYREFEIGTAKPSRKELAQAPHHLLSIAAPDETITAGDYSRLGRAALKDIKERGRLPIVVGGTGLYLRALVAGLFAGPRRSEALRQRLQGRARARGAGYLHRVLSRLDPDSASRIHGNDQPKVIRALEVRIESRQKMSALWGRSRDPLTGFRILRVGLAPPRPALYGRINDRAARMFATGLVDETRALLQRYDSPIGSNPSGGSGKAVAWALSSLGYKQAVQFLQGDVDEQTMLLAAQQGHRNYAKRQITWFRREPDVRWFQGFGDDQKIREDVLSFLESALT